MHDAQLLYLLARHFPKRLGQTPPAALETMSAAVSGKRRDVVVSGVHAPRVGCICDGNGRHGEIEHHGNRQGRWRASAHPSGGADAESERSRRPRLGWSSAKDGPVPAYYVVNESGFDRNLPSPELSKGIEIIHEFLDTNGTSLTRATVGQEFFVRVRVRATDRDRVPQVAVVDLLPGGIEPVRELPLPADTSTAGVDPALMRRRAAVATLAVGVPGTIGLDPESCRRARRPRGDVRRGHERRRDVYLPCASDECRNLPGASSICGGHVQPDGDRIEPGRQARGCQTVTARVWLRRLAKATAALTIALALARFWPHAPLSQRMPLSTAVWSADGELLRVTRSSDDQYRMWVPLSGISPTLVDAVLLKEDRWFYWHPGVNAAALIRGAFRTYIGGEPSGRFDGHDAAGATHLPA